MKATMKLFRISVLALVLCVGCSFERSDDPSYLPSGATNIIDDGNGWATFELDGNKFLYHRYGVGDCGPEAITQITEPEDE